MAPGLWTGGCGCRPDSHGNVLVKMGQMSLDWGFVVGYFMGEDYKSHKFCLGNSVARLEGAYHEGVLGS